MNSSFHFPNFEKFYKSAREAFPVLHDQDDASRYLQRIDATPNKPVEERNSEAASNFSSLAGVYRESPPLNTGVKSSAPHPDRRVQAEIEEALRKKKVVEETAKFFREKVPSPEFFGTLTYNKEVRKESATKIFLEYLRKIAKRFGSHFKVAWGAGYQAHRTAYHHHFSMSRIPHDAELVPPSVTADDLMELWHYGISKVEPYDFEKGSRDRGAAYYIADHEDWGVRVACTRHKACRKQFGCKVERSIW